MNILSLFDGISAGRLALERAGVTVDKYYASEVDKYAMQVSNKNFPDIIQLGDITKWREWDIDWGSIDLVIGGSPCQGFSFAGKQLNFEDPRSKLFFDFVDICHRVADENPKMKFFLENVRMKKEFQDVISGYMGIEPVMINSSLVSAQNRVRFYWTNIPNVTQPEDRGIVLSDIIEDSVDSKYYLTSEAIDYMGRLRNGKQRWEYHKNPLDGKEACLTANMHKGVPYNVLRYDSGRIVGRRINENGKRDDYNKDIELVQRVEINNNPDKTNCLSAVQKDNIIIERLSKCEQIATLDMKGNDCIRRVYNEEGKSPCLTTSVGGHRQPKIFDYEKEFARKLTPIECERLQTFPDNYTQMLLSKNILYICSETNLIKVWQKNAESKNVNQISQVKPLNYATSIILDLLELEQLMKELWQTKRNAHTQLVQKTQKQNKDIVSYITIDGQDTEAQNYLIGILKNIKNVNIVMQLLERKEAEQEECVVDITKTGLDMEMLYSQIINGVKLSQEDTMAKLVVKIDTGLYLKISWEDPLNLQRSFIILTLIKQIIISKIYTYVKTKVNIKAVISNLELLPQNCLKVELLDFQMESILLNSNTQRYKALGNSWTVDVISHILKGLA